VLSQRWPSDARYISGSNESLRRYGHSKLSKMVACRQLGFNVTENSIRSADPENPTLEPNMKCIGSPVAEIWPFAYLGAYGTPIWGEGEVVGSAMAPLERAMVVSYKLSIVTVALSVTIRPQFAIECLRRSNQQGCGSLWATISGCSPWSRSIMFGSAESERHTLTNREIIFEEFQRMWSQFINVTDGQTDGQTTCDRKTALCTKVHRAVKTKKVYSSETTIMAVVCRRA